MNPAYLAFAALGLIWASTLIDMNPLLLI